MTDKYFKLEDAKKLVVELSEIKNFQYGMFINALREIVSLNEEIDNLRYIIEDYREGIAKVLDEKCPSDEVHCGCVPILRQEIERLKRNKK